MHYLDPKSIRRSGLNAGKSKQNDHPPSQTTTYPLKQPTIQVANKQTTIASPKKKEKEKEKEIIIPANQEY